MSAQLTIMFILVIVLVLRNIHLTSINIAYRKELKIIDDFMEKLSKKVEKLMEEVRVEKEKMEREAELENRSKGNDEYEERVDDELAFGEK
jgi:hypothetical protein